MSVRRYAQSMRCPVFAVIASHLAWSQPSHAQDSGATQPNPTSDSARPLELEAGGDFVVAMRSVCRTQSDTTGCSQPTFRGGHVSAQWRIVRLWSVGVLASHQWSPENDGASHTLWHAFADTRVHPWSPSPTDPWVGVLVGVTAATDTLDSEPPSGDRAATAYAPAGGLHAGVDFRLTPGLSLQLTARGLVTAFREPRPLGESESRDYGTATWAWLSLGLMFRPALGDSGTPRASPTFR